MKRAKRTTLPRVTVFAMSRKELVAFSAAVNDIRTLKLELSELVLRIDSILSKRESRTKKVTAPQINLGSAGVPEEAEGGGK